MAYMLPGFIVLYQYHRLSIAQNPFWLFCDHDSIYNRGITTDYVSYNLWYNEIKIIFMVIAQNSDSVVKLLMALI